MKIVLRRARELLNNNKQGNEIAGSAISSFYNIWATFYNDNIVKLSNDFDMVGALSVYDRIDDPNNQGHEIAFQDQHILRTKIVMSFFDNLKIRHE